MRASCWNGRVHTFNDFSPCSLLEKLPLGDDRILNGALTNSNLDHGMKTDSRKRRERRVNF